MAAVEPFASAVRRSTRSDSLGSLLHEIRQPVQTAIWALDLLRNGDEVGRERAIEILSRQLGSIRRVIDAMTTLQRGGATPTPPPPAGDATAR
jgi:signal transduction histidine kinase